MKDLPTVVSRMLLALYSFRMMKHQPLLISVTCVSLMFMFTSSQIVSADHFAPDISHAMTRDGQEKAEDNPIREFLATAPGRRLGRFQGQDIESLREFVNNMQQQDWNQFTPPPITEPNCFVEVQVTQRMPGRCTRLGGRIPACQTQDMVTIDYTCGTESS